MKFKKSVLVLALAALTAAGTANAALRAFKVNGETVTVEQQKAYYDAAVAQGQPAGEELERQVKTALTQQTVILQQAKKAKVEEKPEVKEALKAARSQVLINALFQDWAKKNPVSDADVKKAYDMEKKAYGDTEYQVRHILVKTEDDAKKLIKRIEGGADFAKLAKENSTDPTKDQGGLIGWVVPRAFVPAFASAFSALKPGSISQVPVRTQYGYHVVKLDDKRAAKNFPKYEDQKEALRSMLTNQKMQKHFQSLVEKAKVQ